MLSTGFNGRLAVAAAIAMMSTLAANARAATADSGDAIGRIDQLVAPIALYPDPLLASVLMASTYPSEVFEADRWRRNPKHATLDGDKLAAALERSGWEPSVQSLVASPHMLHSMDTHMAWTVGLGDALIYRQAEVMDEIQKLRRQAEAAGKLATNSKEIVTDADGEITIQPAEPGTINAPVYDPATVFAVWPDASHPPIRIATSLGGCVVAELGYCWTAWPIFAPAWGWAKLDWREHAIDIDPAQFTTLNGGRAPPQGAVWRHDPTHRHGTLYSDTAD
jgi:hypothetical protein